MRRATLIGITTVWNEAEEALQQPLVQRLLVLMRLRNSHPAFDGEFELHQSGDTGVSMAWRNGEHYCRLYVDLPTNQALIDYLDPRPSKSNGCAAKPLLCLFTRLRG